MIKIEIEKNTGMVFLDKIILGRDMENLQEKIQFVFKDTFVDGVGRFEYKLPNGENHYILANKINDTYEILVKNVILLTGYIYMQFVVTESETEDGIPVFKSNVFKMFVKESLNSVTDAPDDYELWIETANAKLAEIDNFDITATRVTDGVEISITDKEGITHTTKVNDGEQGEQGEQGLPGINGQDGADGQDAKVNGYNTITITAGDNIRLDQEGTTFKISSTGEISGSYSDLSNKPTINSIEIVGNKTTSDLNISYNDLKNKPTLFDGNYNNLTNKPTIPSGALANMNSINYTSNYLTNKPTIPSKTSDLTNDSGFITEHQDISGKVNVSDIINDTSHTDTDKPLSANMGKEIQDQIDNLKSRGRFLSLWNCTTGLATTIPSENPYTYKTGDYFIISVVGDTNYKPSGSTYNKNVPSTSVETREVNVDDVYYYDGTNWDLQINTQKTVGFANLSGSPTDNTNLASALNEKVGFTDYATQNYAGVIKLTSSYGAQLASDKMLRATVVDYSNYGNLHNNAFIGKQTLENVIAGKGLETLVITANSNRTINGYQVPNLTTQNIQDVYNGIVAKRLVIISDANSNMHFIVNQADTDGHNIFISFLYCDIMILQYDDSGNVEYKEIATNTVSSTTITSIIKLTQEEYDAITTKDNNTMYVIVG